MACPIALTSNTQGHLHIVRVKCCTSGKKAHRRGLALPLPDLGLLEEEEAVDEHEGHGDQADAKGDSPDGVQGAMVVLAAGLAEDCQQDAQNSRVDQVTPALHAELTFSVLENDKLYISAGP